MLQANWVEGSDSGGVTRQSSHAVDPDIDWLFPLEIEMNFTGDLTQTKIASKRAEKWVLVNIQSHLEFDSQQVRIICLIIIHLLTFAQFYSSIFSF